MSDELETGTCFISWYKKAHEAVELVLMHPWSSSKHWAMKSRQQESQTLGKVGWLSWADGFLISRTN